ncbi:DUF397 domain-containing protein [Streptomyces echinatus]|uniref:DUF397 domain-containing protein n=1 Tax=Streptomyces echinatus TaxID=67293 RepID=A0A7W9UNS3_9ACTN|nr:DUF397 domain-containing protein [Streptomyces echinatus]MBB5924704.1 hypothetical protein [Streptomyces echinatus]
MATTPELQWFKSSHSGGSGTECVECAYTGADALIRDSKQTEASVVQVHSDTWRAFIRALTQDALR